MANPHSTVSYVEPNLAVGTMGFTDSDKANGYVDDIWHSTSDTLERAPRLEDYCIALNLEVEVSSRDAQGTKDVLILQWNNEEKDVVSFMGGTKIGGYERVGGQRNLTTYYADMYVGDLINYGTTEMIGIKSVDIQYEKSCVPMISIKFTDVRGLSLFQPTELSRTHEYDGIKGLSKDNVAQSFFQCFFKMPLPKFTIYIKGFYGKPVAYVMMCDKFDTNFNSETGDYDVDTHFIGYNYSFMTDVSFDALLAAPYSDYEGKKYWQDNINNGRFYIWDKLKTKKMPMPTLYEMYIDIKKLLATSASELLDTTLTDEEKTHDEEIAKLDDIKKKYQLWYQTLFNFLKTKYNKRNCFEFKRIRSKEDEEWYKILILTNNRTKDLNLSQDFTQYPEEVKKNTDDLYSAIEEFNNSGLSYKKLKNISKDFSRYTKVEVFNDCYVNHNTRKIDFGGFSQNYNGSKTDVVNRLFYGELTTNENNNQLTVEELNKQRNDYKDFTLNTIYGDGVNQYTYAYIIDVDYSDINRRIKALTNDANKSSDEKEKIKRRKEHNRIMMNNMNWYPSVENFTKITMAHLETLMMMMYKVQDACKERTPEKLGVTIGRDGNICDTNENFNIVPPFPRITKEEIGDDNITRKLDSWAGEFDNGEGFIEVDMVNGLFNAIDELDKLRKEDEAVLGSSGSSTEQQFEEMRCPVPRPLTSYDFFLTKNPYGTENDVSNNPNALAGKVAMRMFNILTINNFKKELNDWSYGDTEFIKQLGRLEAENFYASVSITNENMLKMLGTDGGEGTITPSAIIECVKKGTGIGGTTDIPWKYNEKDGNLFSSNLLLTRYIAEPKSPTAQQKTIIYPMQNMSFGELEKTLTIFNRGSNSIDKNNEDIIVTYVDIAATTNSLLTESNESCFGNIFILDNFKTVSNILESSAGDSYKTVYDKLYDRITFSNEKYGKYVYKDGVFVPKGGINTNKYSCTYNKLENGSKLFVRYNNKTMDMVCGKSTAYTYEYDESKIESFATEAENMNIPSWFFSECRGFEYKDGHYNLSNNRSFFTNLNYKDEIAKASGWRYADSNEREIGFFLMGLDAIDYNAVAETLGGIETFTYLPKLAVLQIGAFLTSMNDLKKIPVDVDVINKNIMLPSTFGKILTYISQINDLTKIGYIKYYKKWVAKYGAKLCEEFFNRVKKENGKNVHVFLNTAIVYGKEGDSRRALFREDSTPSNGLTDKLMVPVLVAKGNVNHINTVGKASFTFSEGTATNFLEGFIERAKELYGNKGGGGEGIDSIRFAKEPVKVTDDMKQALYNYLKLLYDRWIPSTDRSKWEFDTFFPSKEKKQTTDDPDGHLFHFIDSFYNKIGDKLLVNPMGVSEYIENALDAKNVHGMLLGFLADIYAKNKCMLMCLQNFQDLSEDNAMSVMFKPIPFNSMMKANRHPDFVVVYPYDPSKYLNVDNGEFNDDSFMLNDELDTPIAIRSRNADDDSCYRIPAFGVSYGKQYQSYFKKVKVGMQSPIATQQSLIAKHAILRQGGDTESKGTVGQDMYDIYASQSYTCTVEMMGCAWVQPLMYFVLTNVPMFKGSYLIMKVTHNIVPGNMTTTFTGCRMANVSNRLVEEIFTDDFFDDSLPSSTSYDDNRNKLADVDNDCPYKVYPLYEDTNIEISGDAEKDGINIMNKLIDVYGFNPSAAAGIVGNMYVESWDVNGTKKRFKYDLVTKDSGTSGGLCMWHNGNLIDLVEGKTEKLGHNSTYISFSSNVKNKYSEKLRNLKPNGIDAQLKYLKDTMTSGKQSYVPLEFSKYNELSTEPSVAAIKFRELYERSANETENQKKVNQGRYDAAVKFYNLYKNSSKAKQESIKPNNKDIREGLFNALQKSLDSTNKVVKLKKRIDINQNTFRVECEGDNQLALVFDILLNGYYEYVEKLYWASNSNGGDFKNSPDYILVVAKDKVEPNNRKVGIYHKDVSEVTNGNKYSTKNDASIFNPSFLKSLYKRYKNNFKEAINEIPQFDNMDIFEDIKVKDCNELMSGDYPSQGSNSTWAKSVQSMGKWYEANVHTYQGNRPPAKGSGNRRMYDCPLTNGKVADDCSGFVSACLQYFGVFKNGQVTNSNGFTGDANIAKTLEAGKFARMKYSWETVQPYDIISYNGHVEILAEKGDSLKSWGWGSVHDNNYQGDGKPGMPAPTGSKPKGSTYTNIWRYIG